MFRSAITALGVLVLAISLSAQTVGVPGTNDLVINGAGSGATSCVSVDVTGGTPLSMGFTTSASTLVIGAVANSCSAPGFQVGTSPYFFDLDILSFSIVLDGTGILIPATPLSQFLITDSTGSFGLTVTSQEAPGTCFGLQLAGVNATFPVGIVLTQAFDICIVAETLCPSTVGLDLSPLSDDGFVNVTLSTPFTFYGASFTDIYVNMNGSITFNAGDGDASATEVDMLANAPRIAPAWDDWDPSDPAQGTVRLSDVGGIVEVEWHDLRHFGAACGGLQDSNTFCASLDLASGKITFAYGGMLLCRPAGPSLDQVVGVSPGGGTSLPNNLDLSGSASAVSGLAMYEDFSFSSVLTPPPAVPGFDLEHLTSISGLRLAFTPSAGGYNVTLE